DVHVVLVAAVQVRHVERAVVGEGQVAVRVYVGQDDKRLASARVGAERCAGRHRHRQRGEGTHQARGLNVDAVLVVVEVAVGALAAGQVHKVPAEERVRQRDVDVCSGSGEARPVQIHAAPQVATLGEVPATGYVGMADLDGVQHVAVEHVQPLAQIGAGL